MFNIELKPFSKFLDALNSSNRNLNVIAVPFARRNGAWQHAPFFEKVGILNVAALANNTIAGVANVAVGSVPIFAAITITGSVAGLYEILYNGVDVWIGQLVANTPFAVPIPWPGLIPSTVTGVTIGARQQTGVPANIVCTVLYAEVVP